MLVGLITAPATAGEGLYLTWGDCLLGGGTANQDFGCGSNTAQETLYCALTLAQPVDSVIAVEVVVDLQLASPVLPDWWHLEAGGCRQGALVADDDFTGLTACLDFWQGQTSGGLLSYTVGMPRGGPSQARIRAALGVPPLQARNLNASDMYYAMRLLLRDDKTTGGGACAGCGVPACLVLNSIWVKRPPRPEGVPSTDVFVQTPGPGNANRAVWQGGAGANCLAVPVRNETWGSIKTLYR